MCDFFGDILPENYYLLIVFGTFYLLLLVLTCKSVIKWVPINFVELLGACCCLLVKFILKIQKKLFVS